jgi:hypothetical protein
MGVIDLSGQRFSRLLVIARVPGTPRTAWTCRCDCGHESIVRSSNLKRGLVRSCGCLRNEKAAARHLTHGESRRRSQKINSSREYRSWSAMKTRCYNAKQSSFENYGGRGITICDRWRESFPAFVADMGRCPSGYSLDRIDVDGHYEPGNCRWAPTLQQANNTRANHRVEWNSRTLTVSEWERELGFRAGTLKRRLLLGWTVERAMQPI